MFFLSTGDCCLAEVQNDMGKGRQALTETGWGSKLCSTSYKLWESVFIFPSSRFLFIKLEIHNAYFCVCAYMKTRGFLSIIYLSIISLSIINHSIYHLMKDLKDSDIMGIQQYQLLLFSSFMLLNLLKIFDISSSRNMLPKSEVALSSGNTLERQMILGLLDLKLQGVGPSDL